MSPDEGISAMSGCTVCAGTGENLTGAICHGCHGTGRAPAPQAEKVAAGGAPPLTPEGLTDYERGWRSAVRIAAELCDGEAARYNVESGRWERDAAKRCAREIRSSLGPKARTAIDASVSEGQPSAASAASAPEGTFAPVAALIHEHLRRQAIIDAVYATQTPETLLTGDEDANGRMVDAILDALMAHPGQTQADAKAIPSSASPPPPPEGISVHKNPAAAGAWPSPLTVSQVAEIMAERDAAIARAERAENALWAQTKSYEGACARADKLAAIVKANASGAVAYAEMEGKLAAAEAERDRMREAWIRARVVVFAARVVCAAFTEEDEPHIGDRQGDALAAMREVVTVYDQRNHDRAPAPGGSSGEALGALAEYWRMPGVRATCMAHFSTLAEMIDKVVPPTPERRTAGEG